MSSINAYNPKIDQTVQIYDQFYGFQQQVPVDQYDAVLSYFRSVFKSEESAATFTVSLFRISLVTETPVMALLQQMQGQSAPEITLIMAYYLNGIRSSSTMLGVNVPTQPNFYVARNIVI